MWGLIARWFLTLAPGYFFNDILTGLSNTFNVKPNEKGKTPIWFVLVIMAVIGVVLALIFRFIFQEGKKRRGRRYSIVLMLLGGYALLCGIAPDPLQDITQHRAVVLGVLVTGVGILTTFNTTYIPKYFAYVAATQLTAVRISYQGGGVLLDLDAAGLTSLRGQRQVGNVTNGTSIEISNGFIPNKNLIWEFTNSAAQTPTVYVGSEERAGMSEAPPMVLTATKAQVLANSGTDFDNFAYLGMPAVGATDVINVTFQDGLTQLFNRVDLQMLLQRTQSQVNTPDYNLNNFDLSVKKVTVTATAAFTAYVQMWQPVGEMLEAQLQ